MILNKCDLNNLNKLQSIKLFLDQYPCLYGIKDTNSHFVVANETMAKWIGYANAKEIMEHRVRAEDFRCETANMAEHLYAEDANVIAQKKQIAFLGCTRFAKGQKKILYGTKTPILDHDNTVIGLIDQFIDITHNLFFNLSPIILDACFRNDILQPDGQFSYMIIENIKEYGITDRQLECLFYLLRGKSAVDIAALLDLSNRTVETHIENLRQKLNCSKKSELIEKALNTGLSNYIPSKFLTTKTNFLQKNFKCINGFF